MKISNFFKNKNKIFRKEFSDIFTEKLKELSKRDKNRYERLLKHINKISESPDRCKPLRNKKKDIRQDHDGHFILEYRFYDDIIEFLSYDHHK